MALLFCDGFDQYNDNNDVQLLQKWTAKSSTQARVSIAAGVGIVGGNAMQFDQDDFFINKLIRTPGPGNTEVRVSFWYRTTNSTPNTAAEAFMRFRNTALGGFIQFNVNTAGQIQILNYHTAAGTIIATAVTNIHDTQWHEIEIHIDITSDTTSNIDLFIDKVLVVAFTGDAVQTVQADYTFDTIEFYGGRNNVNYTDDVIIWDDAGADYTGAFGGTGIPLIETILPDGDGNSNNWTIQGSAPAPTRWESVDEAGLHDSDVTYLEGALINDEQLLTMAALTSVGAIHGVAINMVGKLDATGTREMTAKARSGTTTVAGLIGAQDYLSINYSTRQDFIHDDPQTGVPLTTALVDAMEIGIEVTD